MHQHNIVVYATLIMANHEIQSYKGFGAYSTIGGHWSENMLCRGADERQEGGFGHRIIL